MNQVHDGSLLPIMYRGAVLAMEMMDGCNSYALETEA